MMMVYFVLYALNMETALTNKFDSFTDHVNDLTN